MIALFLAAGADPTPLPARQRATVVMAENPRQRAFQLEYGYADAVVVDGMVYVSGVPAFLANGEKDVAKAYHRAFRALGDVLKRSGASWDDVVSMTSYHLDLGGQIDAFAKVKADYVKGAPPAWTAVGTNALLQPGALVEISLIAHLPEKASR